MQTFESIRWRAAAPRHPLQETSRRLAAAMLRAASAALARLALHVGAVPAARPVPRRDPQLEFYAEAGAPEGALYLDGELVGWVAGVRRL